MGQIAWADRHNSDEIEEALGFPLRWVETAHFRLGVGLGTYAAPVDSTEKKKLKAELKALSKQIPKLDTSTRKIDPWVRTHLFARRLERLYDEFCASLGVTDEDFAEAGWGEGPFLGQKGKFCVLIVEEASAVGRYASRFGTASTGGAVRHNFELTGSLYFGMANEHLDELTRNDTALHCSVVYGVTQNLLSGYRGFRRTVPRWLEEGVSQALLRRVDPRWIVMPPGARGRRITEDTWNWEPRVRARVEREIAPDFGTLLSWDASTPLDIPEVMTTWSKVEFLLTDGGEGMRRFLDGVKEPIPGFAGAASPQEQATLMAAAWGRPLEQLEVDWREWVLETYPKR